MGKQDGALRIGEGGVCGYEHLLLNVVCNPRGLTPADLIYTQHTHTNISLSAATSVYTQRPATGELLT